MNGNSHVRPRSKRSQPGCARVTAAKTMLRAFILTARGRERIHERVRRIPDASTLASTPAFHAPRADRGVEGSRPRRPIAATSPWSRPSIPAQVSRWDREVGAAGGGVQRGCAHTGRGGVMESSDLPGVGVGVPRLAGGVTCWEIHPHRRPRLPWRSSDRPPGRAVHYALATRVHAVRSTLFPRPSTQPAPPAPRHRGRRGRPSRRGRRLSRLHGSPGDLSNVTSPTGHHDGVSASRLTLALSEDPRAAA